MSNYPECKEGCPYKAEAEKSLNAKMEQYMFLKKKLESQIEKVDTADSIIHGDKSTKEENIRLGDTVRIWKNKLMVGIKARVNLKRYEFNDVSCFNGWYIIDSGDAEESKHYHIQIDWYSQRVSIVPDSIWDGWDDSYSVAIDDLPFGVDDIDKYIVMVEQLIKDGKFKAEFHDDMENICLNRDGDIVGQYN